MLIACGPAFARGREHQQSPPPALRPNRPLQQRAAGPHLQQWMENHRNLSPAEQQRELEKEPGFRDLPPETQQLIRDRLTQLNNMNPQQRARILDRNEAVERLSPPQRQQYRSAVQSFATMPPERRRLAARAVLDLRVMPPEQREQVINSPAFGAQFSPDERSMIRTLLTAEPYAGDRAPNPGP